MMLRPDWPELDEKIDAMMLLRTGGVSVAPYDDGRGGGGLNLGDHVGDQLEHVQQNRRLIKTPNVPQWLTQVHGTTVLNFDEPQNSLEADACITTKSGIVCAVLTADCLPVLFCDPKNGVIGAAHAGWRGLADGVLENTIAMMQKAGAEPERVLAWLGPAIGPRQFEVGDDVRIRFVENEMSPEAVAFKPSQQRQGKFFADIYQLARLRLQRVGVHQFSGGNHCTFTESEKFYSYRRDGVTGRMASLIWMK